MGATITGPAESRIQQGMGPGLKKGEVRVLPGKPYLVEYVDGKQQSTVDLVFWFGGKHAFLFPKDMAAHLRKNMQVASDRVINAIHEQEGLAPTVEKSVTGLSLPPEAIAADGGTVAQEAAVPETVPAPSAVDVMKPKVVTPEEVAP